MIKRKNAGVGVSGEDTSVRGVSGRFLGREDREGPVLIPHREHRHLPVVHHLVALHRMSLAIRIKFHGAGDTRLVSLADLYSNMANVYLKRNKYAEALELQKMGRGVTVQRLLLKKIAAGRASTGVPRS